MLELRHSSFPIPNWRSPSVKLILTFMLLASLTGCKKSNETSQESTLPNKVVTDTPEAISEGEVLLSGIDLSTYHQCWGSLIEGSEDALSIYAINRSQCRNGDIIIAYEEFLRRENGQPIYNVTDTMSMQNIEGIEAYLTKCNRDEGRGTYFLLINDDFSQEYFSGVKKAWLANTISKKLVSVQPKNLQCINMDYGAE